MLEFVISWRRQMSCGVYGRCVAVIMWRGLLQVAARCTVLITDEMMKFNTIAALIGQSVLLLLLQ